MIKICADSACDFTDEMRNNPIFQQVPLTLELNGRQYTDDFSLNMDEFIEDVRNTPRNRKTAAPAPSSFIESYKGCDGVFALTLSSKLSGSYNSAATAAEIFKEENKEIPVFVVDSKSASAGETLLAVKIKDYINQGLDFDTIKNKITSDVKNMSTFFILENYDSMVDGGRVNSYVAKLANLLNIVPICGANDGQAILEAQVRGEKKAIGKLTELMLKKNVDFENRVLYITHIDCYDKAVRFRDFIMDNINFKDAVITKGSGLCTIYADINGLVFAF